MFNKPVSSLFRHSSFGFRHSRATGEQEQEYEQEYEPAKYASVFNIGLQNTFVYRWNYFLRALFGLIP